MHGYEPSLGGLCPIRSDNCLAFPATTGLASTAWTAEKLPPTRSMTCLICIPVECAAIDDGVKGRDRKTSDGKYEFSSGRCEDCGHPLWRTSRHEIEMYRGKLDPPIAPRPPVPAARLRKPCAGGRSQKRKKCLRKTPIDEGIRGFTCLHPSNVNCSRVSTNQWAAFHIVTMKSLHRSHIWP